MCVFRGGEEREARKGKEGGRELERDTEKRGRELERDTIVNEKKGKMHLPS